MGEGPVVGEQHEAGAGLVQPAGGKELPPGVGPAHQVHHRFVAPVGAGADHPGGLVQHDIYIFLAGQGFAVGTDGIPLFDGKVRFFADLPVHRDPTFGDEAPGRGTGELGGVRHEFVQPHVTCPPQGGPCCPCPGKRPPPWPASPPPACPAWPARARGRPSSRRNIFRRWPACPPGARPRR